MSITDEEIQRLRNPYYSNITLRMRLELLDEIDRLRKENADVERLYEELRAYAKAADAQLAKACDALQRIEKLPNPLPYTIGYALIAHQALKEINDAAK